VASAAFKVTSTAVHAICAEDLSGDGAEIAARLTVRGTSELGFSVHSDPDHKLLLRDGSAVSSVYKINHMPASQYKSQTKTPYTDYSMVEPALTVIKKGGILQQVWTWKTGELKALYEKDASLTYKAMQKVPGYGLLVGIRPETADLLPSIKENRETALQYQGLLRIGTEKGCTIL